METKEEKKKMLLVSLPEYLHKEVKYRAVFRGMTIKQWVEAAIRMLINHEQKGE